MRRPASSPRDSGGRQSERLPRIQEVPRFALESGVVLEEVRQAYFLDGELSPERDNLVLVFHALTGSADAAGDWWSAVIGPGRAIDTRRYAVLCANLLGSCYGTTWKRTSRRGGPAPRITPRDQARLVSLLLEELGVGSVALATGGSLGGMVALEWVASFPEWARAAVIFAAPAAHTAQAIGWNHIHRQAIRIAGKEGLALARMVGMMTYRTGAEFEARFARQANDDGSFRVQSYLTHQGAKLCARFDSESYLRLLDAMDAHDVGRGRGGVAPALRAFRGRLVGVGIPGDLLYSAGDVRLWTDAAGAQYREIQTIHGHDAFLIETDQVGAILRDALAEPVLAGAREEGEIR